jgi:preprotein translocase subunit SecG
MYTFLLTIHVIVCLLVVLIVLVQAGRSGGLSGLMGAGGGDALFSTSSQQSGLRKLTIVLAGLFMATSFGLTILSSRINNQSVALRQFPALPPVQGAANPAGTANDEGQPLSIPKTPPPSGKKSQSK